MGSFPLLPSSLTLSTPSYAMRLSVAMQLRSVAMRSSVTLKVNVAAFVRSCVLLKQVVFVPSYSKRGDGELQTA